MTCSAKVVSPLRSHRKRSWDGRSDDHHDLRVGTAQRQTDSDGREGFSHLLWWVSAHGWRVRLTRAQRVSRWGVKKAIFVSSASLSAFLSAIRELSLHVCSHAHFEVDQNQVFCLTVLIIVLIIYSLNLNSWIQSEKGKYMHAQSPDQIFRFLILWIVVSAHPEEFKMSLFIKPENSIFSH